MANNKKRKIKFDGEVATSFQDKGVEYKKDNNGNIVEERILSKPFVIKSGEEQEIDEETYQYLKEKGALRTKAEQKERIRLRRKILGKKSWRAEPRKDVQTLSDEDINLVYNDLPYEV